MSRYITKAILNKYIELFVPEFPTSYGIQFKNSSWQMFHNTILTKDDIRGHLKGDHHIGLYGVQGFKFGIIDIDNPFDDDGMLRCPHEYAEMIGLVDGEYLGMSSPSYFFEGGCSYHILFRPEYNGTPVDLDLYTRTMRLIEKKYNIEIYPRKKKIIRMPFGRAQHILDDVFCPINMWIDDVLDWVEKLDPFDMSGLIKESNAKLFSPPQTENSQTHDNVLKLLDIEAEKLLKHGLTLPGSRHESALKIAQYLYRQGKTKNEALEKMRRWILYKHNHLSREVNQGRWPAVFKDHEAIVDWTWEKYNPYAFNTDNRYAPRMSRRDFEFCVSHFRGDIRKIRWMVNFVLYCRPRIHHGSIYISSARWIEMASQNTYKKFQEILTVKKILKVINKKFSIGNETKSFEVILPPVEEPLRDDSEKFIDTFDCLIRTIYPTAAEAAKSMGVARKSLMKYYSMR